MKQFFTFCALLSFTLRVAGQAGTDFVLTFEDTAVIHQHYYTDTILDSASIWQIGMPQKLFFDSAFSRPNALVTLLDSSYPSSTAASFILDLGKLPGYFSSPVLVFEQKFDFDSLKSGGYIHYSIDKGQTWGRVTGSQLRPTMGEPLTYAPEWTDFQSNAGPKDTLPGGNLYVTGNSLGWNKSSLSFICVSAFDSTLWLKFTAYSDSAANGHAGWMLDNITWTMYPTINCPLSVSDIPKDHLQIRPNPATSAFEIALSNQAPGQYTLTLTDLMGRRVLEKSFYGTAVMMRRDGLSDGSYLVRVVNDKTGDSFTKQLIID